MKEADKNEIRNKTAELLLFLPKAIETIQGYREAKSRSPQEEAAYQDLMIVLKEGLRLMKQASEFLKAEIYGNALAYYYSIKVKAKRGDEKAKAIYRDLLPELEHIFMSSVDKN